VIAADRSIAIVLVTCGRALSPISAAGLFLGFSVKGEKQTT